MSMTRKEMELRINELLVAEARLCERISELEAPIRHIRELFRSFSGWLKHDDGYDPNELLTRIAEIIAVPKVADHPLEPEPRDMRGDPETVTIDGVEVPWDERLRGM